MLCTWLDSKFSHNEFSDTLTPFTPLFNNSNIKYKNSVLFFSECINKNIVYVKDVCVNDRFCTHQEFFEKINTPRSLLIYNCLYNALKKAYPFLFHSTVFNYDGTNNVNNPFKDHNTATIGRKALYKMLCSAQEPHVESLWEKRLNITFPRHSWMVAFTCTKETRLQVLDWKILMNIYPTSIILSKMSLRRTDRCEYCDCQDTLEHFFFLCRKVISLWVEVQRLIFIFIDQSFKLNMENALLGYVPREHRSKSIINKINLLILLAKLAVSKSKYGSKIDPKIILENELKIRGIFHC